MYFAVIDCGTTNSRIYVLDGDFHTVAVGAKKVGVKDTVGGGTRVLRDGLSELFLDTIRDAGLEVGYIRLAVAFGMITSELGLMEIPHLWAPAGLEELVKSVEVVHDPEVFPPDVPVVFIRGIKNRFESDATVHDVRRLDFLRGEESQVMGLLHLYPNLRPPFTVVVFSSHTKYIRVTGDSKIAGSLTTLSGQIYEAIVSSSAVGKSVARGSGSQFDPEIADLAYEAVQSSGFLRAILMPRFMDVLLRQPASANSLFLTAAIVADDMRTISDFQLVGFDDSRDYVLLGQEDRCRCFAHFIQSRHGSRVIKQIYHQSELDQLSITGAALIASRAGLLD